MPTAGPEPAASSPSSVNGAVRAPPSEDGAGTPPAFLCSFGVIADVQYADVKDGTSFCGTRVRRYRRSLDILKEAVPPPPPRTSFGSIDCLTFCSLSGRESPWSCMPAIEHSRDGILHCYISPRRSGVGERVERGGGANLLCRVPPSPSPHVPLHQRTG